MPQVDMCDMLNHAYRNGYAVGGFELLGLDFLEAIVRAAENCRAPVILNLVEFHFGSYDFELLMAAAEKAARRATVPVALHLDHGGSLASAVRAINLGCNSVMVDASHEPFPNNVAQTRRAVETAHGCGVAVEGELGYDAGVPVEGEEADGHAGETSYTSIEEAKAFVARTGVDCLAVSIGTVHGRVRGRSKLDIERLKRINEAVKIPLVIHGGSGLSDEQYRKLIAHGVARINYSTALGDIAGNRLRANARAASRGGYAGLVEGVQDGVREEVERCLRLWGSAGRAAEVLVQCRAWEPVEHVIVYNVEGATDEQVEAMMARGRGVLAAIPGVRRVFTGWALPEKARFRCCWLVEFAHPKVIESYRDHPDHVAFANQFFRPIAAERISIDFAAGESPPEAAENATGVRQRA
jgi:fructose-bisphosphate aldolase, class II